MSKDKEFDWGLFGVISPFLILGLVTLPYGGALSLIVWLFGFVMCFNGRKKY